MHAQKNNKKKLHESLKSVAMIGPTQLQAQHFTLTKKCGLVHRTKFAF